MKRSMKRRLWACSGLLGVVGLAAAAVYEDRKISDRYSLTQYDNGKTFVIEYKVFSVGKAGVQRSDLHTVQCLGDDNGDDRVDWIVKEDYVGESVAPDAKKLMLFFAYTNSTFSHMVREKDPQNAVWAQSDKLLQDLLAKAATSDPVDVGTNYKRWGRKVNNFH